MRPDADEPSTAASVPELVTGLLSDARDLAIAHVDGFRQEMRHEARNLATTARYTGVVLSLASVGAVLVGFAVAYGIQAAWDLPLWAAFAIASVSFLAAALIVGVVRMKRRRADQEDLIPEHQLASLERDARWLADKARQTVS